MTELIGLRNRRLELGFFQSDAGAIIGKNQSHYAKMERGEIGMSLTDAQKLSDWLDLPINEFF